MTIGHPRFHESNPTIDVQRFYLAVSFRVSGRVCYISNNYFYLCDLEDSGALNLSPIREIDHLNSSKLLPQYHSQDKKNVCKRFVSLIS